MVFSKSLCACSGRKKKKKKKKKKFHSQNLPFFKWKSVQACENLEISPSKTQMFLKVLCPSPL